MEFVQFIEKVENRLDNPGPGEAEQATTATFEALGESISGGEASDLAAQLPEELKGPLQAASGEPESLGLDGFFSRVGEKAGVDENRAADYASSVMAVLGQAVSTGEIRDVRSQLPQEFQPLLQG